MADAVLELAVVGAHLSGQPLNHQLTVLGAELSLRGKTAPHYRLFALDTTPPKPGLLRVAEGGASIELEVWALPEVGVGRFLAGVAAPLCIGQLELPDGRWVHGFLCEASAIARARDITHFGSWRAFLASLSAPRA